MSSKVAEMETQVGLSGWLGGQRQDAVTGYLAALAAACERSDIVIAARWLPRPCRPRWIKADRNMLGRTGGLAIYLNEGRVVTVAAGQGRHGWWREPEQRKFTRATAPNEAKATPQPKTQPEP